MLAYQFLIIIIALDFEARHDGTVLVTIVNTSCARRCVLNVCNSIIFYLR